MLQQVREQTLPGPGLILDCNTLRGNNVKGYYNEVNNQNLLVFNLIQRNTNDVVDDPNYQSTYRVGLDLTAREDQGEFNSHLIIL